MTLVLGLDVATTTGWAHGNVDATAPAWGVVTFKGKSPEEVFASALEWAGNFMVALKPDVVMIEALLPPTAMKDKTSRAVRDRLCGLNAIFMGSAFRSGAGEVATGTVHDIRAHFIGITGLKRAAAKTEVKRKCLDLGWNVENDNAADAVAVWSYACSLIDPRLALRCSPLFKRISSMSPIPTERK